MFDTIYWHNCSIFLPLPKEEAFCCTKYHVWLQHWLNFYVLVPPNTLPLSILFLNKLKIISLVVIRVWNPALALKRNQKKKKLREAQVMILIIDQEPVIWNQPMTKTQEKQKIKKKNQYYTLTVFKKMYGLWLIKIWVWAFWVEEGNLQATGFHSEGVQGLGKIKWADWSRKGHFLHDNRSSQFKLQRDNERSRACWNQSSYYLLWATATLPFYLLLPIYGHLWRTPRRFSVSELFSRGCLDWSTAITEEVRTLLRLILSKVSDDRAKKVDLNYFFTITSLNVIMKMNAGKKRVEEEKAACIDSEKQCIEDVQKIFPSNPGTSLLDFFPILKWIGYNGDIEESTVIKRGMNSCRAW